MATAPVTLTIPSIVVTIIIAGLCGALAQMLVGYTHGGLLASILVGFVGALLGNYLAVLLGIPPILVVFGVDIVWTIVGSVIFVGLLSLILGGRRYGGYRPWRRRYY